MKNTTWAVLAVLMLAPAAMAAIDYTDDSHAFERFNIIYNDSSVQNTTTEVGVHVATANATSHNLTFQLMGLQDSPWTTGGTEYTVDVYLVPDVGEPVLVAEGLNDTATVARHAVGNDENHTVRFVAHFPATRETGIVDWGIIIGADDDVASSETGSGGTLVPSIGHRVEVYFYDPLADSDQDGLRDDCEIDAWGHLHFTADQDPDQDGFTNIEECLAGSDPSDPNSHPATDVYSGSGGTINDREIGVVATLLFIVALLVFVAVWMVARSDLEAGIIGYTTVIGATIMGAMLVLFAMDTFEVTGIQWAFWSYAGLSWAEYVVWAMAGTAILAGGTIALAMVPQAREGNLALGTIVALLGAAIVAVALFVWMGVALPWS